MAYVFVSGGFIVIIMSGSIFIGMFLYSTDMNADMKMRLAAIDVDLTTESSRPNNIWPTYAREVEFHAEIAR